MAVRAVLVVEDDDSIRQSLKELIEGEGYPVVTAANGREALALLRKLPSLGLVLLDLVMPVMSGAEFMAVKRADPVLQAVPVGIVSAWPHQWVDQGSDREHLLAKPINTRLLLTFVARYCA